MRTEILTRAPNWNNKILNSRDVLKFLQPWWFTWLRKVKIFRRYYTPKCQTRIRTELLTRAPNWNNKTLFVRREWLGSWWVLVVVCTDSHQPFIHPFLNKWQGWWVLVVVCTYNHQPFIHPFFVKWKGWWVLVVVCTNNHQPFIHPFFEQMKGLVGVGGCLYTQPPTFYPTLPQTFSSYRQPPTPTNPFIC